ncbi:hypothetical protein BT67DRAFT_441500 [Trichocladium antarcticum]|uniref:C2H2-type domain-containing protein n=1 Tax=Trichocladium antarcticum TaxID=1450529 RepID=A0AAN6ULP7_9PEZI|nr:hypothetical protein BT67DRAFT_441500 [Trichocladium antarcticum]
MAISCASCGKSCATLSGLATHCRAKRHPYCLKCNRSFVDGAALGKHHGDSHVNQPTKMNPVPAASTLSFTPEQLLELAAASAGVTSAPPPPKGKGQVNCEKCSRVFGTAAALRQHERDSPAHRQPDAETTMPAEAARSVLPRSQHPSPRLAETSTQAAGTALADITHRGNTYTTLPPSAQSALYPVLLQHCHPSSRLALSGYPLVPTATRTPTATPPPSPALSKRKALVLDCEMAGSAGLPDQVVALSAADFFTGETLIDALVEPTGRVTQWRTPITGITRASMAAAVASGTALRGTRAAVERLFALVDAETVLVGHSLWHDLKALGVAHGRVIDTGILTAEASGRFGEGDKVRRTVGLERLCRELAGLVIRAGGACHDGLEDVLATRELAIWCLTHPEELKEWAVKNWAVDAGAGWTKGGKKRGGRGRGSARGGSSRVAVEGRRDRCRSPWYDDKCERWEDVVDYDTWPKSPPDWSD